ncbi:expressed unknown protein [Seminavis robusta]|uniref:Uncharacterized protein n=1 Tax=Seminavis robusta TaxID=568900 RepID=A0A9N8DE40_9STRA|nr:expressed unknown protein [Seminavis robusta]|eukprot:Sro52_g031110.1 n/a (1063) ;mRNA; r:98405-101593
MRTQRPVGLEASSAASQEEDPVLGPKVVSAWKNVDEVMSRNDQEALSVLHELRESLQRLESVVDAKQHQEKQPVVAVTHAVVTALDTMDAQQVQTNPQALKTLQVLSRSVKAVVTQKKTPQVLPVVEEQQQEDPQVQALIRQLATNEAQEFQQRESRIQAAKENANHVTMAAKWDQQQQHVMPPKKQTTPKQMVVDATTSRVAAQELTKFAQTQARLGTAMEELAFWAQQAKLDLQQASPIVPTAEELESTTPESSSLPTMPHDPAADALVAQLASLEATQHATKQARIQHALEDANHVTMAAKWDMQQQHPAVPRKTELPLLQPDEEAAHLVAQLAAMEAAELAARDALVDKAKLASQHMMMQDKISMQQQSVVPEKKEPTVPTILIPRYGNVIHNKKKLEEDTKLEEEDNDELEYKQDLLESVVEASETILEEKEVPQVVAAATTDDETEALVTQLASMEAKDYAIQQSRIEKAKEDSNFVTMQAKLDQQQKETPAAKQAIPTMQQQQQDEATRLLVAQLAAKDALEHHEKQARIEYAKDLSEFVTMTAKLDQQQQQPVEEDDSAALVEQLAALERAEMNAKEEHIRLAKERGGEVVPIKVMWDEDKDDDNKVEEEEDDSAALVAQLAALERFEFEAKEERIRQAKEQGGEVVPVKVMWEEDDETVDDSSDDKNKVEEEDDSAALVAQLAAMEKAEFEAREEYIRLAKEQEGEVVPVNVDDEEIVDDSAALVAQLAAMEKAEFEAREEYIRLAKEQEGEVVPVNVDDEEIVDDSAALVAQLAAMEKAEFEAREEYIRLAKEQGGEVVPVNVVIQEDDIVEKRLSTIDIDAEVHTFLVNLLDEETADLVTTLAAQQEQAEMAATKEVMEATQEASEAAAREVELYEQAIQDIQSNSTFLDTISSIKIDDNNLDDEDGDNVMVDEVIVDDSDELLLQEIREMAAVEDEISEDEIKATEKAPSKEPPAFFFASKKKKMEVKTAEIIQGPIENEIEEEPVMEKSPGQELAAKEHDEVQLELTELFEDVSFGFKEVKSSLAKLLSRGNSTTGGEESDDQWDGFTP